MQPPLEGHAQEGEAQPPEPAVANRVPPGFRFHPTDEELVWHYLRPKVADRGPDFPIFGEIEIYKYEPWDLPVLGVGGEHESYFFTHRKRKYPGGHRAKRTTEAGYWKATGKDKPVYRGRTQIGMKKTLVYYQGRAPNAEKMDWVMHEYRLMEHDEAATSSRADLSTADPVQHRSIGEDLLLLPFWVVIRIQKKKAGPPEGSEHPGEASSRGARASLLLSDDDNEAPDPATHEVKAEPVAETASLGPVGREVIASSPLLGLLQDPEFQSRAASQTSMQAVASSPSKPTSSWAWHTPQPLVSTLTSGPLQASTLTDLWQPQASSAGAQQTTSSGTSLQVQPNAPSQLQARTRLSAQVGEPDQAPAAASGGLAYLQAVKHMQLQQVAAAALDDSNAQQLRLQQAMAMQTQGGLMDILQGGGQAQPHNRENSLDAAAGSAEGQPWLDPVHLIKLHNLVNSCAVPPVIGSAGSMGQPPRQQLQQQSTPHSYLRPTLAMSQDPLQLQRLPLDTFALAAQRMLAQGLPQQGGCELSQDSMAETLTLTARPDAHALHREQYLPSLHNVQPEDNPNRPYNNLQQQSSRENQMLNVIPFSSNQLFAQQAQPAAELVLDSDKVEASSPKNVVTLGGDLAFSRPTCGALEAALGSAVVHGLVHFPSWLTAESTPTLHNNMKRQLLLPPSDTYTKKTSPSRSPLCISTIEEGAREDSDTLLQHDDEVSSTHATPLPCTLQQAQLVSVRIQEL
eukprot:SM000063S20048  [mRNA]  locus=s63:567884:572075:+ [translate_table: standard]